MTFQEYVRYAQLAALAAGVVGLLGIGGVMTAGLFFVSTNTITGLALGGASLATVLSVAVAAATAVALLAMVVACVYFSYKFLSQQGQKDITRQQLMYLLLATFAALAGLAAGVAITLATSGAPLAAFYVGLGVGQGFASTAATLTLWCGIVPAVMIAATLLLVGLAYAVQRAQHASRAGAHVVLEPYEDTHKEEAPHGYGVRPAASLQSGLDSAHHGAEARRLDAVIEAMQKRQSSSSESGAAPADEHSAHHDDAGHSPSSPSPTKGGDSVSHD